MEITGPIQQAPVAPPRPWLAQLSVPKREAGGHQRAKGQMRDGDLAPPPHLMQTGQDRQHTDRQTRPARHRGATEGARGYNGGNIWGHRRREGGGVTQWQRSGGERPPCARRGSFHFHSRDQVLLSQARIPRTHARAHLRHGDAARRGRAGYLEGTNAAGPMCLFRRPRREGTWPDVT